MLANDAPHWCYVCKITPEAWNRAAGAWMRACEQARSYTALEGETPLTVCWWLFEKGYEYDKRS
jgi:hypothetical protein